MPRTITRTQVQEFTANTEALLGRGARRISGSVDVVNGIVVTENLRYLTHVGEVTVSTSPNGDPMLFGQDGRQVSTYAPPEDSVMSISSLELVGGEKPLGSTSWKMTRFWEALTDKPRTAMIAPVGIGATGAAVASAPIALFSSTPFFAALGGCMALVAAAASTFPLVTSRNRADLLEALVTDLRQIDVSYVRDLKTVGFEEELDEALERLSRMLEIENHHGNVYSHRWHRGSQDDYYYHHYASNMSQEELDRMRREAEHYRLERELERKKTYGDILRKMDVLKRVKHTAVASAVVLRDGELHRLYITRSGYEMLPLNQQGRLDFVDR